MLLSMNVTVIPFLLKALIFIENMTEWNFGPEYVFQLNKSTTIYTDRLVTEDVTAMVKCRPTTSFQNVQNILSCHAYKIIVSMITQQIYKDIWTKILTINKTTFFIPYGISNEMPDQFFEIEFSRQGVEGFKMEKEDARKKEPHHHDSIRDIIEEQFHIGIDLHLLSIEVGQSMKKYENRTNGSHVISFFPQYGEDTIRASKCNTSWIITYTPSNQNNKDEKSGDQRNERKSEKIKKNFQLKLIPISYTNPIGKIFSIDRSRMRCARQPQYFIFQNQKWDIDDMTQYYNKMEIRDKNPKFTSYTHLEGYAFVQESPQQYLFSENVFLHLLRIKPAQNELIRAVSE